MEEKKFKVAFLVDEEIQQIRTFTFSIEGIEAAVNEIKLWRLSGSNTTFYMDF